MCHAEDRRDEASLPLEPKKIPTTVDYNVSPATQLMKLRFAQNDTKGKRSE